jgi:hypothetical protein
MVDSCVRTCWKKGGGQRSAALLSLSLSQIQLKRSSTKRRAEESDLKGNGAFRHIGRPLPCLALPCLLPFLIDWLSDVKWTCFGRTCTVGEGED